MTTGKTIALTRWTFVGKVMTLLLNMLSRLVITFLPRSKCLLISWLQSPSAVILEPPKIKSDTEVLLKSQSPFLFSLINYPFLAWLPGSFSLSLHLPYKIFIWNPGNIDNLTVVSWETLKPRTKKQYPDSWHTNTVKLQLCIMLSH